MKLLCARIKYFGPSSHPPDATSAWDFEAACWQMTSFRSAQSPCFPESHSSQQRWGSGPGVVPHLLGRVLLQVPGLALLAGEAVQAVEALLQGCLQLLLVGVCVFRGGCSKLLLENSYLQRVGEKRCLKRGPKASLGQQGSRETPLHLLC